MALESHTVALRVPTTASTGSRPRPQGMHSPATDSSQPHKEMLLFWVKDT